MLKSIVHEILGGERPAQERPKCLAPLIGRKHTLLIFVDAEDDRAARQDAFLKNFQMQLIHEDIEVFRVAGGGVFPLFDASADLDADEIRDKLQGPEHGRFAVILLGYDGEPILRSYEPVDVETILTAIGQAPAELPNSASVLK
ncbi:DUF4174 domain-containing protein [Oryzifoliimicrobium ureilyticus]|uniref:DUF4174 domain-containing protein n=1 Tax=Oryzifoliimicrobium ureilyticus TaxID=3113724 RepID=UPI0030762D80